MTKTFADYKLQECVVKIEDLPERKMVMHIDSTRANIILTIRNQFRNTFFRNTDPNVNTKADVMNWKYITKNITVDSQLSPRVHQLAPCEKLRTSLLFNGRSQAKRERKLALY